MTELNIDHLQSIFSKELEAQEFAGILSTIADLARVINQDTYKLHQPKEEELNIKKALELGIRSVGIKQSGTWVVTGDELGDRYSFASRDEDIYLYKKYVSDSSPDEERDKWSEVFYGNSSKLGEVSENKKIIEAIVELGTAILAVSDQLKASKSA